MLIRLFTLIGLLFCATSGYSSESLIGENNALISEIVANDNICVQSYDEDKIYLNPERIIPTEQGLFLNLNGEEYVALPMLFSDDQGCYIELARQTLPNCPLCQEPYIGSCTNPKCQGKENRRQYEEEKKRKKDDYKKRKKEGLAFAGDSSMKIKG